MTGQPSSNSPSTNQSGRFSTLEIRTRIYNTLSIARCCQPLVERHLGVLVDQYKNVRSQDKNATNKSTRMLGSNTRATTCHQASSITERQIIRGSSERTETSLSLRHKSRRGDMIHVYKIKKQIDRVGDNIFFTAPTYNRSQSEKV